MGMFGKLMFWKKSDDLGLKGDDLGLGDLGKMPGDDPLQQNADQYGLPQQQGMPHDFSQPQQPFPQQSMQQPYFQSSTPSMDSMQSQRSYRANSDMELVSAKLDAIRAALDSINQRLANLERIAEGDSVRRRGW
ncbi:hypothetical protein JXB11_03135 [Candidatus Woesearchaeota archaeon]|nr:hypothetical protein [Candidatus Woesearchaeota archaeon]